ncbi:hypothetical protein FB567DRAFT_520813 [Paraphoma chrysanthemicola]|uniref:Uncharacterized protein n=1 Tax=Paraphoma chrysanthemicola TaxID=798071 RepID=A0A8K0W134_9PLEO|nr:hypothetical protein FB567DRAFT_520813 [Paraphoma chrysanthemicola]
MDREADSTNLTEPFVFRAVKAGGTDADAKTGGFWSASYYIVRPNGADTSSILSSSAIPSPAPPSSIASLASSVWSSSEKQQTPVPSSLQSGTIPSPSAVLESPAPSSGVSQGAVVGLAAGLSIAFVIIVSILGVVFWRRRKTGQNKPSAPPVAGMYREDEGAPKPGYSAPIVHEVYVRPEEVEGSRAVFELPTERGMHKIR